MILVVMLTLIVVVAVAAVIAIPLFVLRRNSRFYAYLWACYALISVGFLTHFFVRMYLLEERRGTVNQSSDPQLDYYFSNPLIIPVAVLILLYLTSGWGVPRIQRFAKSSPG